MADDVASDFYPLGDGPGSTSTSFEDGHPGEPPTLPSTIPPLSPKCQVCRDLTPCGPQLGAHADTAKWQIDLGISPPPGFAVIQPVTFGGLSFHDHVFVKEWTPPWPPAAQWIESAINGCIGCRIVVDAASAFVPAWFENLSSASGALKDNTDSAPNKIIIALSTYTDQPLDLTLVDTSESWFHKRHIRLQVFTNPAYSRPWPSIGSANQVSFQLGDAQSLKTIGQWIRECDETHEECRQPSPSWRPTRLLELEQGLENQTSVKLIDGSEAQSFKYAALSYCWGYLGKTHWITTTTGTLNQHRHQLSFAQLPIGLQHAIKLAVDLGYQYLWIDALCIIQNDPKDWKAEAESMTDIYANAHLVIGCNRQFECVYPLFGTQHYGTTHFTNTFEAPADGADYLPLFAKYTSSDAPGENDQQRSSPYSHSGNLGDGLEPLNNYSSKLYVRVEPGTAHQMMAGAKQINPLYGRGWTLQENLLAIRFLDLNELEMSWKCVGARHCECGLTDLRTKNLRLYVYVPGSNRMEVIPWKGYEDQADLTCLSTCLDKEFKFDRLHSILRPDMWMKLLSDYSGRTLTYASDALIAIKGLEKAFRGLIQRITGEEHLWDFLNGMPRCSVNTSKAYAPTGVEFLLWRRDQDVLDPTVISTVTRDWPFTARWCTLPVCHGHPGALLNTRPMYPTPDQYYDMGTILSEVAARLTITGDAYICATGNSPQPTLFPSWHIIGRCGRKVAANTSYCFDFMRRDLLLKRIIPGQFSPSINIHSMNMDDISDLDMEAIFANRISHKEKVQNPFIASLGDFLPGGKPAHGELTLVGPFMPVRLRSLTMSKPNIQDDGQPFSRHTVLKGAIEGELNDTRHFLRTLDEEVLDFIPDARHIAFGDANTPEMSNAFPCTCELVDLIEDVRFSGSSFWQFHQDLMARIKLGTESPEHIPHKVAQWPGFCPLEPESTYRINDGKGNVEILWPCLKQGSLHMELCKDTGCDCRKAWTEMNKYPAYALKMGHFPVDQINGKRVLVMVYMVLTWINGNDLERKGRFNRIGLGAKMMFPGEAGYIDPFRHAGEENLTIV